MRTPLMPAADRSTEAGASIERSAGDRIDDQTDAPWGGVHKLNTPEEVAMGGCARTQLGGASLVDLSGIRLAIGDDSQAVAARMVFLQAVVEGAADLVCGGESHVALRAGHVVVRPAASDAALTTRSPARILTLAVPNHMLAPRFIAADAIPAGGAIFHASLAGRLLYEFLVGLSVGPEPSPARVAPILDAAAALVSLALAERPPAPVSLSALAAARADEIVRYLERNFANAVLTPTSMAEDLGISVRYAHKLLEQTGRSFRQELVALRLRAARRAFAANGRPRQTIADIAISVGFNDLSQFNRHFRQAYGMTPRAARLQDEHSAQGSPPPEGPSRGARRERPTPAAPPGRRASPP